MRRAVFDIHRHIVDQLFLRQGLEALREASVGVKLDPVAQSLQPSDEVRDLRMKKRFSPGDAHPVQDSLPLPEEGKDLFRVR